MLFSANGWAAIGAIALALGTIPSAYFAVRDAKNRKYYSVLAAITGIATVAYTLTSLGVGSIPVDGATFYTPRYVDWLLTTPLLILYLTLLCKPGKQLYALLIGLDVVLIALGIAAIFTSGVLSLTLFGLGGVAYLALAYLLVTELPDRASFASERVGIVFAKLRNVTVVLWTLYPVVWLLAPVGFGLLEPGVEMMVIVYLDIITKVGFAMLALMGKDALDDITDQSLQLDTEEEQGTSTATEFVS
ncbi:sensory rhodopsin-2 [Halonotius terrestris]|uniref:Sensory rhodopsin-2 n=1 Tax=Halonotius terrestris TaxID=2487750 RepID=A0A8J8TBS2_9EURY|nr:bacteriorhodopsin [Halonotius terrestris]TQQ82665.1 sensory rhodopsin-2 [Halonotius terrestris]